MRKLILLSVLSLMAMAAYSASPASNYEIVSMYLLTGDINYDGQVNTGDVSELYVGLLNGLTASKYDINGDGQVNTGDVSELYKIILGTSDVLQPTSVSMNEYRWATSSQGTSAHVWQLSGEVIYITLDGVEENMYTMVLDNGEWLLKDISGSSKAGFATSGTIKALWVRNSNWASANVGNISIPYDYALGAGTYRCKGNKVSIQLNLTLAESRVYLTSTDASNVNSMSYATHVTSVFDINRLCAGESGEFVCSTTNTPSKVLMGSAYWIFGTHNDIKDGYTVLHKTDKDGLSFRASVDFRLDPGEQTSLPSSSWERDFFMRYYDNDNTQTSQELYHSTTKTIKMIVGSEMTFYPHEGDVLSTDGTTSSRTSSNTTVVKIYDGGVGGSTSIKAMKVGEANITFVHATKYGESFTFKAHVVVEPAVWLAGSLNSKPALYRNGVLKYNSLSVDATTINQVFVRKGSAYIRAGKGSGSTAYVMRSANPVYSGSFSTRFSASMSNFLVTNNGDIWHTYSNNIYKNNSLVLSPTGVIADIVQDESSGTNYVWVSGYISSSNGTESSSSDVAWLLENVGGSYTRHTLLADRYSTEIGGYQPDGRYYTGDRSPHFGKMTIQYGFILINGFDIEERAYRNYEGQVIPAYYNVKKTYTYDASNGFLRQNSVDYPDGHS